MQAKTRSFSSQHRAKKLKTANCDTIEAFKVSPLPMDIWTSIFSLLRPHEVLRLQRVSKEFQIIIDQQERLWAEWTKQQPFSQLVVLQNHKNTFSKMKEIIIKYSQQVKLALLFAEGRLDDYISLKRRYSIPCQFDGDILLFMIQYLPEGLQAELTKVRNIEDFRWLGEPNKELIEKLASEKISVGVQVKLEGLLKGCYGFPKDAELFLKYIEELYDEKLNPLKYIRYTFSNDCCFETWKIMKRIWELNQKFITQNKTDQRTYKYTSSFFFKVAMNCISRNEYLIETFYEQAKQEFRAFTEREIEKGNEEAIEFKLYSGGGFFEFDINIYSDLDKSTRRSMNEALIEQGNEDAIWRKVYGLSRGIYGYDEDKEASNALYETLVKRRLRMAVLRKLDELFPVEATQPKAEWGKFIEELTKEGNALALEIKISGLYYGHYAYPKEPQVAEKLNDVLVLQGNREAIKRKLRYSHNNSPQSIPSALKLIATTNDHFGLSITMSHYLFGLNIERDTQKAASMIKRYYIHPFKMKYFPPLYEIEGKVFALERWGLISIIKP
jgi:hypothetical protein